MPTKSNKRGKLAAIGRGKRAVEAAVNGASIREIAAAEGVTNRTIKMDMRRPAVQAALEAVYRVHQERIARALERALPKIEWAEFIRERRLHRGMTASLAPTPA